MPIVGLTAHETLTDILEVHRGDVVLITAAAGGVGHLAVQIASRLGGRVIATASRRNEAFVRGLGAETVIDYQSEDLVEAIRSRYPQGVDKAVNGVEGETANQVVQALRDGGQMVDLTGSATAGRPDVRVIKDYVVRADGDRLATIARMIDDGHLRVEVQQVFPFERARPPSSWSRPSTCAARSCSRSRHDRSPSRRRRNVVENEGGGVMAAKMDVHEGVIRPSLVDGAGDSSAPGRSGEQLLPEPGHAARCYAEAEGSGPDKGPSEARGDRLVAT